MKRLALATCVLSLCVGCHSMDHHGENAGASVSALPVVERGVANTGAVELPVTTDYIGQITKAGSFNPIPLLQAKARMKELFDIVRSQPNDLFRELRVKSPILELPGASSKVLKKSIPTIFVVTKYSDVTEVLNAHDVFAVDPYKKVMDPTLDKKAVDAKKFGGFMLDRESTAANSEKPVMHEQVLSSADLDRVRQIISLLARQAIAAGTDAEGKIDVVASVTRAVPLGMNGEYFGFPGPSLEKMAQWSRDTQYAFFHNPFQTQKKIDASLASGAEMHDYVQNVLIPDRLHELKNGRPAYDPLSRLLQVSVQHPEYHLTMDRVVVDTMGLLVGSVETTSAAITQALEIMMADRGIFEYAVKAAKDGNDQALSAVVWEALRFKPVNPWLARYARTGKMIAAGTPRAKFIPAGSLVLVSTQSAMHDPEVFTDPEHFHARDPNLYMHLGYGNHRCLGDDVAKVMVPETIKQLLLLPDLRITNSKVASLQPGKNRDKEEWVFPENWVLQYKVPAPATKVEKFDASLDTVYGFLGLGKYVVGRINAMPDSLGVVKAIGAAFADKGQAKQRAMEALPAIFVKSTIGETPQDVKSACLYDNPKSITVFPIQADREKYCSVRLDFRGCYFVERIIGKRTSQDAYNHCVFGQPDGPNGQPRPLLTSAEQAKFKADFVHMDLFSFLSYEQP